MLRIVHVQPLHLEEEKQTGYGFEGDMSRKAWREHCFAYFSSTDRLRDRTYSAEQSNLLRTHDAEFDYIVIYENGTTQIQKCSADRASLDLIGLTFDSPVSLSPMYFGANGTGSTPVLMQGCTFNHIFQANRLRLGKHASEAPFAPTIYLNDCTFLNAVRFEDADFKSNFFACRCTFTNNLFFREVSFLGEASFSESIFAANAEFGGVKFSQKTYFRQAQFQKEAGFGGVKFSDNVYFEKAHFASHSAWFEGATFDRGAHFEHAQFKKVPTFIGVKLETFLIFSGSKFELPSPTDNAETWGAASDRFTALKHLSESCGQIEQVLRFNGHDLYARYQSPHSVRALRYVCNLYESVSDYGRSFTRPLYAYLALLICTWFFAFNSGLYLAGSTYLTPSEALQSKPGCEARDNCAFPLSAYRAATEYTVYRAVGVLDFSDNDKKTADVNERLFGQPYEPAWMRLWGIFKAIMSTVLLFLTALGLRNRYRLK